MTAKQLLDTGHVRDAEQALSTWLRDHPSDSAQRTFLFELLCLSGRYERAGKQLAVLARDGGSREVGAVLYFSALHAERARHDLFRQEQLPPPPVAPSPAGRLNGKPFTTITDADPQIGPRLEVFAAGAYLWIEFAHLAAVRMEPPRRLRDTLWAPAVVSTGPAFLGKELGEVLVPAIYPFSWQAANEQLWLGRETMWSADSSGKEYPFGQKILLVDGVEVPLLEVRSLEFDVATEPAHAIA